jgi:hypothetical protein
MSNDDHIEVEELEDATWVRVMSGGFKTHFCPSGMAGALIADLAARGAEGEAKTDGVLEGLIDLPGMIMMDRPLERIEIDGFTLIIPSQDFTYFVDELANKAPVRKFADGQEYHKIHGWMVCVVMTPAQRQAVLEKMDELLPEASRRGDEADDEFSRRMSEINKDGVKVVSMRDKKNWKKIPEGEGDN